MVALRASLARKEEEIEGDKSATKPKETLVKNKGVEERMNRDMQARRGKERRRMEALQRKAALYERLSRGEAVEAEEEILVDFSRKRAQAPATQPPKDEMESGKGGEDDNDSREGWAMVLDEFGRALRVSKTSKEYLEYVRHAKEWNREEDGDREGDEEREEEEGESRPFKTALWESVHAESVQAGEELRRRRERDEHRRAAIRDAFLRAEPGMERRGGREKRTREAMEGDDRESRDRPRGKRKTAE